MARGEEGPGTKRQSYVLGREDHTVHPGLRERASKAFDQQAGLILPRKVFVSLFANIAIKSYRRKKPHRRNAEVKGALSL